MSNKIKGVVTIFLMSLLFYMMITTKYTHALGDYILEFIGVESWTGNNYSGFHLTIIYFGVPFIISLLIVEKYAVDLLNMRRTRIFLIFIFLMTVFYLITGTIAVNIKKNSPGLLSVGYSNENSHMEYKSENNKITEFNAEFELTNYSNEIRTFYLSIDSSYYRQDGIKEISFYTLDGKKAIFQLRGNETKLFSLNLNDYRVEGGRVSQNGWEAGIIKEIVLTNDKGDKVRLDSNNGFLAELSR